MNDVTQAERVRCLSEAEIDDVGGGNPMAVAAGASVGVALVGGAFIAGIAVGFAVGAIEDALTDDDEKNAVDDEQVIVPGTGPGPSGEGEGGDNKDGGNNDG